MCSCTWEWTCHSCQGTALKEAAGALRLFKTMAGLSATSAGPTAATHWREAAEIIERLAVVSPEQQEGPNG